MADFPAPAEGIVLTHFIVSSDVGRARRFYAGVLGFDVTTRGYPGALFVSAGGYHHHLGLNTWHSAGSGPAALGAVGMRSYEIVLPDRSELDRVLDRVRDAGLSPASESADSASVRDASGNLIVLLCR